MNKSTNAKRLTIIMTAIVVAILYTLSTYLIITLFNIDNNSLSGNSQTADRSELNTSTENSFTAASDIMSTVDGVSSYSSSTDSSSAFESSTVTPSSSVSSSSSSVISSSSGNTDVPIEKSFASAMWFSYSEDMNFKGLTQQQVKSKIDKMFDNAVNLGNDAVICQVRPFADAYYKSDLFPWSSYITGTQGKNPEYDPMAYMIEAAHKRNLQFHAWLNPYRISTSTNDPNKLSDDHIAKKWWNDSQKKRNILIWENGIYFNPTRPECQKLIIDGVKEILNNYDVDGIHIDDYFYPTDDADFDKVEYDKYKANGGSLNQADWRRQNVSTVVQGIWREVHKHSGKVFGISPSYHISKNGTDDNYTKKFADLKMWMNTKGYIDYIVPQIYFGYEHSYSKAQYTNCLNTWIDMPRLSNVKLYIGLGAYKIGLAADGGSDEWATDNDILAKQALDAYNKKCDGVFIFNYSTLYADSALAKAQLNNLRDVLKSIK